MIFFLYALTGFVWVVAWYWWFRDDPHHHRSVNEAELKLIGTPPPASHPHVPWSSLLRKPFSASPVWHVLWRALRLVFFPDVDAEIPAQSPRVRPSKTTGWLAMLPLLCMAAGVAGGRLG